MTFKYYTDLDSADNSKSYRYGVTVYPAGETCSFGIGGNYGMCAFCGVPIEASADVFSVPGKGGTEVTLHRSCLGELLTRVIALVTQDK